MEAGGKFFGLLGSGGKGRGELDWPIGVCIDTSDLLYVSEGGNCRVSVFTSEGHFVRSFGEGLGTPHGLAVDDNGVVYVCYRFRVVLF